MARSVLIVDKDAARRGELAAACNARGALVREADDPFSAMAALGQQSFDALCAFAGPRHLSLRGLFQLAKRKREDIAIWAFVQPDDRAAVELSFGGEAGVLDLTMGAAAMAAALVGDTSAGTDETAPVGDAIAATFSSGMPADVELGAPPLELAVDVDVDDIGMEADLEGSEEPALVVAAEDREVDLDHDATHVVAAATDDVPVVEDGLDLVATQPDAESGFGMEFKTPAPAGAWNAAGSDEGVEVDPLLSTSTSGEGAPFPSGAETLIALFARELTGRLVIRDGDRAWRLYLYGGEPAWVDLPGGDAAVFERLVARALLPPDASPASVPEGELIPSLIDGGVLSRDDAQAFMRQLLFDVALDIAALDSCSIEVAEAPQFLSTPPPFRVNPFGLVLESRRRRTRPDDLLLASREIKDAPLVARRSLDKVYGKVAPFLRGVDVRSILENGSTLRGFQEAAGVDEMLATQLVLALEAVGLVRIDRAAVGA